MKYSSKHRKKIGTKKKNYKVKKNRIQVGGADRDIKNLTERITQQATFLKPEIDPVNNLDKYKLLVESVPIVDRFEVTGREIVVAVPPRPPSGEVNIHYHKMKTEMDTHKDNLKDLENHTSVISFLDLRGIVLRNNFKIVPRNTFICFMSPLDMSISANFSDGKLFLKEIMKISPEKYQNLFNFRTALRYNSLKADKLPGEELPLIYSSCFANSFWYYPGQVYPEMKFQADYRTFRADRYTEKFCYITYDGTRVSRPEYNPDVIPIEEFRNPASTISQDIRLSEVVKCRSRTEDYRMIIVFSSRGLENRNEYTQGNLEKLMNLEMVNYHLVQQYEEQQIEFKTAFEMFQYHKYPFQSSCGYVDSEIERLINFKEYSLVSQIDKTYNINYHGMASKLKEIYDSIPDRMDEMRIGAAGYKYISFCTYSEARFISGLHPRLILQFLQKVKREKRIENRRYLNFFTSISDGFGFTLEKILHYIKNSAGIVSLLADPTIHNSLLEVCNDLACYFQDFKSIISCPSTYEIKDVVKKIQKLPSYETLIAKNIRDIHKGETATPGSKKYRNIFLESPDELGALQPIPPGTDDIGVQMKIQGDIILDLSKIQNAKSLFIYSSSTGTPKVQKGVPMPNLEVLTLDGVQISGGLLSYEMFPNLKILELKNTTLANELFRDIRLLGMLQSLTLNNITALTDISIIDSLPLLEILTISNMPSQYCVITNRNLKTINLENILGFNLAALDKLDTLQICGVQNSTSAEGFPSYIPRKMVNLTLVAFAMRLEGKFIFPLNFKVKNLILSQMRISSHYMVILGRHNYLVELKLRKNVIEGDNNAVFANQSNLKSLVFFNNEFLIPNSLRLHDHKYDSVIIRNNLNLDVKAVEKINVKNKKIVD